MFCSHSSQSYSLNDKTEELFPLSYCRIDFLSIIIDLIFISMLIIFILVKRKKFVDFKQLKTTPNSSPNTTINENSVHISVNPRNPRNFIGKLLHSYNEEVVKQFSSFIVFSLNILLILELLLILHLFKKLFIIDLLSIVLSLISAFIALFLLKRFVRQRKSLFIKIVLTLFWIWSIFSSLAKFVLISVTNKDHYLELIRVYAYLALFLIYSILTFNELANILKPVNVFRLKLFFYFLQCLNRLSNSLYLKFNFYILFMKFSEL